MVFDVPSGGGILLTTLIYRRIEEVWNVELDGAIVRAGDHLVE